MDKNITDRIVSISDELLFAENIKTADQLADECYSRAEDLVKSDDLFASGYTLDDVDEVSTLLFNQTIALMQLTCLND